MVWIDCEMTGFDPCINRIPRRLGRADRAGISQRGGLRVAPLAHERDQRADVARVREVRARERKRA
jgi:hypothetical protein